MKKIYFLAILLLNFTLLIGQNSPEYFYSLGKFKAKSSDFTAAIEAFDQAIEMDKDLYYVYSSRADSKSKTGDFKGALQDYDTYLALIKDLNLLGDPEIFDKRDWVSEQVVRSEEQPIVPVNNVVQQTPNKSSIKKNKSNTSYSPPPVTNSTPNRKINNKPNRDQKKNKKADDEVVKVPENIKVPEKNLNDKKVYTGDITGNPNDFYPKGMEYYKKGDFYRAMQYFTKIQEIRPNDPLSLFKLGNSKHQLNDYKGALEDYETLLSIPEGKVAAVYSSRAYSKMRLGDYNGAIADFMQSLSMRPNDYGAILGLGVIKQKIENYEESVIDFSRAISLDQYNYRAYYNRGISYHKLKEFSKAVLDFTAAIHYNNSNSKAYFNRGLALYMDDKQEDACVDFKTAAELGHQHATNYISQFCDQ